MDEFDTLGIPCPNCGQMIMEGQYDTPIQHLMKHAASLDEILGLLFDLGLGNFRNIMRLKAMIEKVGEGVHE